MASPLYTGGISQDQLDPSLTDALLQGGASAIPGQANYTGLGGFSIPISVPITSNPTQTANPSNLFSTQNGLFDNSIQQGTPLNQNQSSSAGLFNLGTSGNGGGGGAAQGGAAQANNSYYSVVGPSLGTTFGTSALPMPQAPQNSLSVQMPQNQAAPYSPQAPTSPDPVENFSQLAMRATGGGSAGSVPFLGGLPQGPAQGPPAQTQNPAADLSGQLSAGFNPQPQLAGNVSQAQPQPAPIWNPGTTTMPQFPQAGPPSPAALAAQGTVAQGLSAGEPQSLTDATNATAQPLIGAAKAGEPDNPYDQQVDLKKRMATAVPQKAKEAWDKYQEDLQKAQNKYDDDMDQTINTTDMLPKGRVPKAQRQLEYAEDRRRKKEEEYQQHLDGAVDVRKGSPTEGLTRAQIAGWSSLLPHEQNAITQMLSRYDNNPNALQGTAGKAGLKAKLAHMAGSYLQNGLVGATIEGLTGEPPAPTNWHQAIAANHKFELGLRQAAQESRPLAQIYNKYKAAEATYPINLEKAVKDAGADATRARLELNQAEASRDRSFGADSLNAWRKAKVQMEMNQQEQTGRRDIARIANEQIGNTIKKQQANAASSNAMSHGISAKSGAAYNQARIGEINKMSDLTADEKKALINLHNTQAAATAKKERVPIGGGITKPTVAQAAQAYSLADLMAEKARRSKGKK